MDGSRKERPIGTVSVLTILDKQSNFHLHDGQPRKKICEAWFGTSTSLSTRSHSTLPVPQA
eukprot:4431942-Prorocentrum_lima.AAC.1